MPSLGDDRRPQTWLGPSFQRFAASIPSPGHPRRREDAFFLDETRKVAGVFDGVGGHEAGEVGARVGRDWLRFETEQPGPVGGRWVEGVLLAARMVMKRKQELHNTNMETTAVVASVSGGRISLAWCGDSRAYGIGRDGSLVLLTRDHSLVDQSRRDGTLTEKQAEQVEEALDTCSTVAQAEATAGLWGRLYFQRRNIVTSTLGSGPIDFK